MNKEIRIKTSMIRSDLCDFNDIYIVVERTIAVTDPNNAKKKQKCCIYKQCIIYQLHFKDQWCTMTMQKIWMLLCQCTICLNTVKITEKQLEVCGIITEMNQVIIFLLILNLLNTKQVLHETLIILVMVKLVMMQTNLVKMKLKLLYHYKI